MYIRTYVCVHICMYGGIVLFCGLLAVNKDATLEVCTWVYTMLVASLNSRIHACWCVVALVFALPCCMPAWLVDG